MSSLLERLPAKAQRGLVNVIVDTPKGSCHKFKYEEDTQVFALTRILPAGMFFPYDFGSIPRTLAQDGDALDVMIIGDAATFLGCLITVRLIGTIRARQTEKGRTVRNDRLLGVPVTKVNKAVFLHVRELPRGRVEEIEHFLVSYNHAQGKRFVTTGLGGPERALAALADAQARYERRWTGAPEAI
jgi:inorganic pyrophosphatase